ncbi:transporter substrate-binding domain-containing protein [Alphaproteobacteria bacterium LSUCC0684]
MNKEIIDALAPKGVLRAGINMANFLLVSGIRPDGTLEGVSPDLARRIAAEIGVPCEMIPYESPGALADAVRDDEWDIANIAAEAERAQQIDFSLPYVQIDANFLTRKDAAFTSNTDVDKDGVRIAAYERSAYDLWLTENFTRASMIRSESIARSHQDFKDDKADVLASLKPKLLEEIAANPDFKIIEPPFTGIKQSVGIKKGNPDARRFLDTLITDLIGSGFIEALMEKYGVDEKLSIPAQITQPG